jgi:hypothetical protein
MRLWSIHPEYLDAKGLVALWRESLLAQKVLLGETIGYKNHPQLIRFKKSNNSIGAIATYLRCIQEEAEKRGYKFNSNKIVNKRVTKKILVNSDQIEYEFTHLLKKLKKRDPANYKRLKNIKRIKQHPLFNKKKGGIEEWEIVNESTA